ncbi:DNA primase [bacterium]|nr:DNA primase [bacterium]
MRIDDQAIRDVRESTDIVEIVSEYVSLKKRGGQSFFGLCPFHQEKTPSFSVNADRQIYRCFGCGKGGNVFTFLMEMERINFLDAVTRLAERAGIKLKGVDSKKVSQNEILYRANELAQKFYRTYLLEGSDEDSRNAKAYLERRGLTKEIVERFEIGLSPDSWDGLINVARKEKIPPEALGRAGLVLNRESGGYYDRFRGRLMFPIRNAGKKVVGFGARILKEVEVKEGERKPPKYINSPETEIYMKGHSVYGLQQARDAMRQENHAILVERYTDLIALHRAGFTHSVATLGTALTSHQGSLISRFAKAVTILYDADTAGSDAAFRGADILAGVGLDVKIAGMPQGEDPDSLFEKEGSEGIAKVLAESKKLIDFKIDYFKQRGKLDSPQGKTEATRAVIETLRKIPDRITRQYAMHDASDKLGIDERLLWREYGEIERVARQKGRGEEVKHQRQLSRFDLFLKDLLWVLLRRPEHHSIIFNLIHSADLGEHPIRPVFALIEEAWILGEIVEEASLYDSMTASNELQQYINDVLSRPEPSQSSFEYEIISKAAQLKEWFEVKKDITVSLQDVKEGRDDSLERYQNLRMRLIRIEQLLISAKEVTGLDDINLN